MIYYRNSRTGRIVQQVEPGDYPPGNPSLATTAKHMINALDMSKRWTRVAAPESEIVTQPDTRVVGFKPSGN